MFRQNFTCSALLEDFGKVLPIRGYHPLRLIFPDHSGSPRQSRWPGPRSLVTTSGVSVDVLSSGYLDISVHRVCFPCGMTLRSGFPIRKSTDQSLFAAPRGLSQRITSFIASQRQGIHQMPLETLDRPYTKADTGTNLCICHGPKPDVPNASFGINTSIARQDVCDVTMIPRL